MGSFRSLVVRGIWIGVLALSGLVGARIAQGTMDEKAWLGAAGALALWVLATPVVVAAYRALARRKAGDHAQE